MAKIIGIDLGTSTSEVSYIKDGNPKVIKNELGEEITLSVVGVGISDEWIVGSEAKARGLLYPGDTIMEVKRLMGTDGKISLKGKAYTPEEISAEILKYLKSCAEVEIGEKIEKAVITVPAYFTDKQRQATVKAGKLADLDVVRIINEPTAAALTYGIDHMNSEEHILIYDLGGGTFDVTLLEMFDGILDVKASSGNNSLGGKDFDQKIINYLLEQFEGKNEIDLASDVGAMIKVKQEAENCKIALSIQEKYLVSIPFIAEKNGEPLEMLEEISKKEFEGLISEFVKSTGDSIDVVLKDSKILKEDIDLILLVGGSTKIPLVKEFVEAYLSQKPKELVNPDLAVAQGAAVQAGIIANLFNAEDGILITDVCPYSLGTEVIEDQFGFGRSDVMDILIKRNTTIPVSIEKIYETAVDHQSKVEIKVYQGEDKTASRNNLIEKFELTGIPRNFAGEEKIKIKFSYDMNGMLEVEGVIESTGKSAEISVNMLDVKIEKEIEITEWENSARAKELKAIIRKVDRIIKKGSDDEVVDELMELSITLKKALIEEDDELIDGIEDEILDFLEEM